MYNIGDLIIYGGTGVCRITDIATYDIQGVGKNQLYYVLKPLYQDCVISAPVDTKKVFMRPIITKEQAEELISLIPSMSTKVFHSHVIRELTEHYEKSLKTHDCGDLIELTMSIYAKKRIAEQQNRKFGAVDEKFMKRAEELLFGELAAALDIPKDKVSDYISERVSENRLNDNDAD